jgi:hypothetical protein
MLELLLRKLWLVRGIFSSEHLVSWILFLLKSCFMVLRGSCAMMSNGKVERGVMGVLRRCVGVSPTTIVNLLTSNHKLHNQIRNTSGEESTDNTRNFFISVSFSYCLNGFVLPSRCIITYHYISQVWLVIGAEELVKLVEEGRAVRPWLVLVPPLSHQLFIPPQNG